MSRMFGVISMEQEYFKECLERLKETSTLLESEFSSPETCEMYETDGNVLTIVDYRERYFYSFKKAKGDKNYMFAEQIVIFEEAKA